MSSFIYSLSVFIVLPMTNDENMPELLLTVYCWLCWLTESNTNVRQILHKSSGEQQNILTVSRKNVRCLSASDLTLGVESISFKRNGALVIAFYTCSFSHSFKHFFAIFIPRREFNSVFIIPNNRA